jgi:hypothetical protein
MQIVESKYIDIVKTLTVSAAIAYGVSWSFFFAYLSFFQNHFGKVKGAAMDYLVSWAVFIVIGALLAKRL